MEDLCRTSTTVSLTPSQYPPPKHADTDVSYVIPVTGPLSELQIAYVCRETLQVLALFSAFKHIFQLGVSDWLQ